MRQIKIYSVLSISILSLLNSCRSEIESDELSTMSVQLNKTIIKSSFRNNSVLDKTRLQIPDTLKNKVRLNLFTETLSSDNNPHNMPPVK